jgi:hypothetical protein
VKEKPQDLLTDTPRGGWRRADAGVASVALQGWISAWLAGDWKHVGAVAEAPTTRGHLELVVNNGMSQGEKKTPCFLLR